MFESPDEAAMAMQRLARRMEPTQMSLDRDARDGTIDRDDDAFVLSIVEDGQHVLVTARGDVDVESVQAFHDGLRRAVARRPAAIRIDLAQITFLGSEGIRTLVLLYESAAGHPPPLAIHAGEPRYLEDGRRGLLGVATRLVPTGAPEEACLQLAPGDLVVTYTDGLIERRGEDLSIGLERLRDVAEEYQHLPVGSLCDALLQRMSPPGGFSDDVAILAVRLTGATPAIFVDAYHAIPANLRDARHRLRHWLESSGALSDAEIDDVLLAVGEASSNALEHGSRSDPDRVVGVEVSIDGASLFAEVTDTGAWQHDAARSAQLGRGRGLMIMRGIMDEVRITNNQAGTTLTMTRHLTPRPASEPR